MPRLDVQFCLRDTSPNGPVGAKITSLTFEGTAEALRELLADLKLMATVRVGMRLIAKDGEKV